MSHALDGKTVGFLGGGAMAEALIGGLLARGFAPAHLKAADPDPTRRALLQERHGVSASAENADVVAGSDLLVIAIKPGVVPGALAELRGRRGLDLARPLWISIAAGIPLERLEAALPGARIVRAMPNTPALVGAGATAFFAGARVAAAERTAARTLFESVGTCWEAPSEGLLDAVTGLSGSGPAYVFVFMEALGDAGVRMGLPREAAYQLAFQTILGAAKLALATGHHPAVLKDQVTSPGGTTIAGLERLEACGFRAAIYEAVAAATHRARELAAG